MSYGEKLRDPRWQRKRLAIMSRDDFSCRTCGARDKTLHVHHRQYLANVEPWDHPDDLLVTLCDDCHQREHQERRKIMADPDRREFVELLTATMQVYGANLGTAAIGVWWGALSCYTLAEVRAGLSAHVTNPERGRFAPKPADVIAVIIMDDGRPGADEAWAQCPFNEAQTTVWTEEAREAFFAGAYHILCDGDRIAARMAFKDSYERLVTQARRARKPVTWSVSLGHDTAGRESVLRDALERGRLTQSQVDGLLPYREQPTLQLPIKRVIQKLADRTA